MTPNPVHPYIQDAHFRKWAWADEQSWDRAIISVLQGRPATDGSDPSGGWDKSPSNPVIDLGAGGKFDDYHVAFPCALRVGKKIYVYYSGHNQSKYAGIGLAIGSDPFGVLTRYSTDPILDIGAGSDPDVWAFAESVIYDHALKKFVMWYQGYDSALKARLCRATSDDGLSWTKYSPPNVFDFPYGGYPCVIKVGKFYHCVVYYGATGNLCLWRSNDGINWLDHGSGNPILTKGSAGAWDDGYCNYAGIFWNLGLWFLMYLGNDGTNGRIGMALSIDGFNFTKFGANPIFSIGANTEWDDTYVGHPSLLLVERTFYDWYQAYDGTNWRIGVARMVL